MRKGGSKSKGNSFERDICRELSKWVSCGEREDCYWRSSLSGGKATIAKAKGKMLLAMTGDISCINPIGQPFLDRFYLELKFYRDLNYTGILTGTGHLVRFWEKTVLEANCYGKMPILITKQNHLPITVALQSAGLTKLGLADPQAIISAWRHGMHIFLFEDFIKWAKPI